MQTRPARAKGCDISQVPASVPPPKCLRSPDGPGFAYKVGKDRIVGPMPSIDTAYRQSRRSALRERQLGLPCVRILSALAALFTFHPDLYARREINAAATYVECNCSPAIF